MLRKRIPSSRSLADIRDDPTGLEAAPIIQHVRPFACQAVVRDPGLDQGQSPLRLFSAVAENDEIVGVSNHAATVLGHEVIQRIQIDIGQEGTYYSPLRGPSLGRPSVQTVQNFSDQVSGGFWGYRRKPGPPAWA